MRKIIQYIFLCLLIVLLVVTIVLTYIQVALPNVGPAKNLKFDYTPARIARGEYLTNHVMNCIACHSKTDHSKFFGPIEPGTYGMGGDKFDRKQGLPGTFYSSNITPAGLLRYSDGELLRVITTGVNREGNALFPIMPYSIYGRMDTEEIYSIIAYLRSLPPIDNDVPPSVADFPVNFMMRTFPKKAEPQPIPDTTDFLAYGEYLVTLGLCKECHTKDKNGDAIPELAFSGGRQFTFPDGTKSTTPNITPDKKTGIGDWTKEVFVRRFKIVLDSSYASQQFNKGKYNTSMPWQSYSGMTTKDLEAIYDYLHSLKPMKSAK